MINAATATVPGASEPSRRVIQHVTDPDQEQRKTQNHMRCAIEDGEDKRIRRDEFIGHILLVEEQADQQAPAAAEEQQPPRPDLPALIANETRDEPREDDQ